MTKPLSKFKASLSALGDLLREAEEAAATLEQVREQVLRLEKMFRPSVDLSHVVELAAKPADAGVYLVRPDGSELPLKR